MLRQSQLDISVSTRSALVPVSMARVVLSVDEDSVLALIDHGKLRWAWDISVSQKRIRSVRIWLQCVIAHRLGIEQPGRDLSSVVPEVIGVTTRTRLRASEVRELLCCCQQHIPRLVSCGALDGEVESRTRWVTRVSLEQFLTSRLIT